MPYKLLRNKIDGSEGFTFRAADVMTNVMLVVKVLKSEAMRRPQQVPFSFDGALFTRNQTHVLGGLKFNDPVNPLRHSRNSCFPVICLCSKETQEVVDGPITRMIKEVQEAGKTVLPTRYGIKPCKTPANSDMKAEWSYNNWGGGGGGGGERPNRQRIPVPSVQ